MSPLLRVLVLSVSLLLLVIILELVRRGKLREEYSLLLLLISSLILFLAIFRNVLVKAAELLGVDYTPSLLVGVAFFVTFAVQIAQGVIISSLSLKSRDLVQKVAQLEWQIRQLRNQARTIEEQQKEETDSWVTAVREMMMSTEESEEELAA
jgi:cytochrome c oxidase assembly factor CtaG